MGRHLSVATVIEKNRIASDKAFVVLLDIQVLDENGNLYEHLRLARNAENLVYGVDEEGEPKVFEAANFDIDISEAVDAEPTLRINAVDPAGVIRERMDKFGGGIEFPVSIIVVNTGNLEQPPEIEEEFLVVGSDQQGYNVTFTLGVDNPLNQRFPVTAQNRDACPYLYKGVRCKYAGDMPSCDYTYNGANGCKAHDNARNFGGYKGLATIDGL